MRFIKSIFVALVYLFATTGLIIVVTVVILIATGRITTERADLIGKVLRGEKIDVRVEYVEKKPEEYAEEINKSRREVEEVLKRKREEIEIMEGYLLSLKKSIEEEGRRLDEGWKKLEDEKKAYEAEKEREIAEKQNENFQKNLKNFSVMDPEVLANLFQDDKWEVKEIVKYLRLMKERSVSAVIEAMQAIKPEKAIQISLELGK